MRVSAASPLERLKRSVADSTISDDLLPQPSHPDEYVDSTSAGFYDASMKMPETLIRTPLELDYLKETRKMIGTRTAYDTYDYEQSQYAQMSHYMNPVKDETSMENVYQKGNTSQHSFVQIGNMVEIVPRDLNIKTEFEESRRSQRTKTVVHQEKSQIVQVREHKFHETLGFLLCLKEHHSSWRTSIVTGLHNFFNRSFQINFDLPIHLSSTNNRVVA